jgi:acyl carrier protein
MNSNVVETIREFVLCEFLPGEDPDALTETTPLISGGIIDSIDSVKLIVFLETEFDIVVEAFDVDLDLLDTVEALERFVNGKRQAMANG